MAQYYSRIREVTKKYEFANEEEVVRDHLIKTMVNNKLRVKKIQNNWSLKQIVDEWAVEEESTAQAEEIQRKLDSETEYQRVKKLAKDRAQKYSHQQCGRCGSKHDKGNCKAYGGECYKCGKRNHFARMCRKPIGNRQINKESNNYQPKNKVKDILKRNR